MVSTRSQTKSETTSTMDTARDEETAGQRAAATGESSPSTHTWDTSVTPPSSDQFAGSPTTPRTEDTTATSPPTVNATAVPADATSGDIGRPSGPHHHDGDRRDEDLPAVQRDGAHSRPGSQPASRYAASSRKATSVRTVRPSHAKARLLRLEEELLLKQIEIERFKLQTGAATDDDEEEDDHRSLFTTTSERRVEDWLEGARRKPLALEGPQHVSLTTNVQVIDHSAFAARGPDPATGHGAVAPPGDNARLAPEQPRFASYEEARHPRMSMDAHQPATEDQVRPLPVQHGTSETWRTEETRHAPPQPWTTEVSRPDRARPEPSMPGGPEARSHRFEPQRPNEPCDDQIRPLPVQRGTTETWQHEESRHEPAQPWTIEDSRTNRARPELSMPGATGARSHHYVGDIDDYVPPPRPRGSAARRQAPTTDNNVAIATPLPDSLIGMFDRQQQMFLHGLSQLSQAVASPASRNTAPRYLSELPPYSGAFDEWYAWRDTYIATAHHFGDAENKARLRRSLRGPAKDLVEGLLKTTAPPSEILASLEEVYGRPDDIVYSELEKLKSLPRLTDAGKELAAFACKVDAVVSTIVALNREAYLVSPQTLHMVEDKMSALYRSRWYDFEARQPEDEPGLLKIRRFLKSEMRLQVRHIRPEMPTTRQPEQSRRNQRTLATHDKDETPSKVADKSTAKSCEYCKRQGHFTQECRTFKELTLNQRWEACKKKKICFRCLKYRNFKHHCSAKRCDIDGCRYFHHHLLHNVPANADTLDDERAMRAVCSTSGSTALLKIVPVTLTGPKGTANVFAILDGGSTITLLKEEIALEIGAEGPARALNIEGIAGAKVNTTTQLITINIKGRHCREEHFIDARTIPDLGISGQTVQRASIDSCVHLKDIADQLSYQDATPSILIGQDNWELLISNSTRTGCHDEPVASLTGLGWVIHGLTGNAVNTQQQVEVHRVIKIRPIVEENIDKMLQEHFALESLGVEPRRPRSDPEQRALNILEATTKRKEDGSFEVGLLWKNDVVSIPDNYDAALRRLEGVEKKLDKDLHLKARYTEQMERMLKSGYAEVAPTDSTPGKRWYLPHFAVINPAKPEKLRIVHDAAAITKGTSLNQLLLTGPDLLQSLPGVLMRFRQRQIAVTADIKDMFLRIGIREEDRDALRFLWRDGDRKSKPSEYRMKSVIFGATSSPASAIFVKNKNAEDFRSMYPEAADAITRNHYMDDYLQSFNTIEEAQKIAGEVDTVHRKGHFELQKWTSNEPAAIQHLTPTPGKVSKDLDTGGSEKILGLVWHPHADTLGFNLNMARVTPAIINGEQVPTKRETLRTAMSLFDPLGIGTPVTIQAKHILQETWRLGIGWDDRLPTELAERWYNWLHNLRNLSNVALPRCYSGYDRAIERELHTFVDASEKTYATAVFWRVKMSDGTVKVSLAAAKGRVAPLKTISIPRLELQAAVLGCRLATTVQQEHDERPTRRFFWTDSKTVLAWLRAGPRVFKQFVAYRVAEIEETSRVSEWRWVPTKDNVADDATRDTPDGFDNAHRWFKGPTFLYGNEDSWPAEPPLTPETTGEEKTMTLKKSTELRAALPDPARFSSWLRLIRATGRVLQFIQLLHRDKCAAAKRKRTKQNPDADPTWTTTRRMSKPRATTKAPASAADRFIPLEAGTLMEAQQLWLRALQQQAFPDELARITGGSPLASDSRIRNLAVFLDEEGIMRVKSRIDATDDITPEQRAPPIVDGSHPYTRLLIDWVHRELHHGGVETVANEVLQRLWVLRLRPTVRGVLRNCQACRLRRAKPTTPPTGDLPSCRLAHHQRPFSFTGLDFFGPLSVTVGRQHQKRYVALFTCLTTRAVHLEITESMTTDSCVMALRRMMARRGRPTEIWSDNGSNLRGTDAELRQALDEHQLTSAAANALIRWRFLPPLSPFMAGAWERLVRSVKTALRVVLHEQHPRDEVLSTLLAEVEATVNSRPLTHVYTDGRRGALTPNHFLLGGPSRVPLPGVFSDSDLSVKKMWRASQRLADQFWARWLREYLPTLQHRREPHGKGEAIKIGDLVFIVDAALPRNTWLRGIVVKIFPGPDGITRTADIRTTKGILRRPVKKLVVIPTINEASFTAGECSRQRDE